MRKEYWDEKILAWESARYERSAGWSVFPPPIRARAEISARRLRSLAALPLRVADLGCGSGRLAALLENLPQLRYQGYDISSVAVGAARAAGRGERFRFFEADVAHADFSVDADIVVLLGLSDWLAPGELAALLARLKTPRILISYSLPTPPWFRFVYLWYRRLRFSGMPQYEPRAYTRAQIEAMLVGAGFSRIDETRCGRGFGRLLYAEIAS